jgi:tRNA threonylcarbamoyladenosine biosynthesis protein TsaE
MGRLFIKRIKMIEIRTSTFEETVEVGLRLGKLLRGGDVVCLEGNLGTGKTAFTSGIAEALGVKGYITSPTFTIVNEYNSRIPLYHFDVYRITDSEEMYEMGFEEYLESNGVVVIEWANLIKDAIPKDYIRVEIGKNLNLGLNTRIISLEFIGNKYIELKKQFGQP